MKRWKNFIEDYPLLGVLFFILFYVSLTTSVTVVMAFPEHRVMAIAVTLDVGRLWYHFLRKKGGSTEMCAISGSMPSEAHICLEEIKAILQSSGYGPGYPTVRE